MKQLAFLYNNVKYVTVIGADSFIRSVLPSDTCNAVDAFKIASSRGVAAQFKKLFGSDVAQLPVIDEAGSSVEKRGDIFIVSGTFTDASGTHTVSISSDNILVDGVSIDAEPAPAPAPAPVPAPVKEPEPEEPTVEEEVVEEPAVEEEVVEPTVEEEPDELTVEEVEETEATLEEEPEIDEVIVPVESVTADIISAIAEGAREVEEVEVPEAVVAEEVHVTMERPVPVGQGFAMSARKADAHSIIVGSRSSRPGFTMHSDRQPAPKMPKSFTTGRMRACFNNSKPVVKSAEQFMNPPVPEEVKPTVVCQEDVPVAVGEITSAPEQLSTTKEQQALMKASIRATLSSEANAVIGDIPHALLTDIPEFTSDVPDAERIRIDGINYCIKNHWHKCGNWFATDCITTGSRCFYNTRRDLYVEIATATCKKWYKAVRG